MRESPGRAAGDLPVGLFVDGTVESYFGFPKNISIPTYPKSILELSPSRPTGARFAIVTDVGCGMRWTRQRFARDGIAGRVDEACERSPSERTRDVAAYGEVVWS